MTESTTIYLLDAMALAYRSHFQFISRPLINSKGFNTSATYGFTNALVKLIEDHKIDHMAVVFDVLTVGGGIVILLLGAALLESGLVVAKHPLM